MPTAKARYTGDGAGSMTRDFSDELKGELRGYYRAQQAETDPTFGHPAGDFVSGVLNEARVAISELHWQQYSITKPQIRAECKNLLSGLRDLRHKLRNLSPDFDRLLGIDANPLGIADSLDVMIGHVEVAGQKIDQLPSSARQVEAQHPVMLEMAIRVLHYLKNYSIPPSATAGNYLRMLDITDSTNCDVEDTSRYISDAVKILKLIGDDIGLTRSHETWRDTISEAKQEKQEKPSKNTDDLR